MIRTILLAAVLIAAVYVAMPHRDAGVRVVVLQDLGQTAPGNGIPFFTESDFVRLLDKVSTTGGEVAFGTITGRDEPLVRVILTGSKNAYQKGRRLAKLMAFRHQVIQKLSFRQLNNRTDMAAAINRANTFLKESNSLAQYLIVISDGGHTSGEVRTVPNAHVLVVGSTGHEPVVSNARNYESIAAAIDSINAEGDN